MKEKSIRLLFVCEQAPGRELVNRVLDASDLTIEVTPVDSQGAFEALLDQKTWDVLLCGIRLQGSDPFWALETARQRHPTLPVVVLDPEADVAAAVRAMKLGATEVMRLSPSDLRRLPDALRRAVSTVDGGGRGRPVRGDAWQRQAIELSVHGLCVLEGGRLLYANAALAEMLATPAEELRALTPDQLAAMFELEGSSFFLGQLPKAPPDDPVPARVVVRVTGWSGEPRWLDMSASRTDYEGRPAVLVHCVDVSERILAEEVLRQREERYRLVSQLASSFVYAGRISPDGSLIIEWRVGAFEEITGYSHEELQSADTWSKIVHPEDVDIARRGLERLLANQLDERELRILHKDGEIKWLRIAGRPEWDEVTQRVERILGVAEDITPQKEAEEALQQAARRLETLLAIERAMLAARSLEDIARAAMQLVSRLIPCRRVNLVAFDLPEPTGRIIAAHVDGETNLPAGALFDLDPRWLEAFTQGEPVVVPDLDAWEDPTPILQSLQAEGIRCTASVPVRVGEELLGSLNLAFLHPYAFSDETLGIAQEVANSLAVAMWQARLNQSERVERQAAQALAASARDLSASLDPGQVFDLILDRLKDVVPYRSSSLILLRETGADLVASRGLSDLFRMKELRRSAGGVFPLERKVIATREPHLVDDVRATEDWIPVEGLEYIRSWMGVPLVTGERVLGCLNLEIDEAGFYTPALAELASAFASHAATAIHNARLFAVERRLREQQAALHAIALEITLEHDLPVLLRAIVERAVRLLEGTAGGLYLCDPLKQEVRCVVSHNTATDYTGVVMKYGEGAAGRVAETGEPLVIDDYRTWPGRAEQFEDERPFAAVLSAPMLWHGQATGVIHVLHDSERRRFTTADRSLLLQFASQAAIAVQNARLLEAERTARDQAESLRQALEALTGSLELEQVLENILLYLEKVLPYARACVLLVQGDWLEMVAGRGFEDPEGVLDSQIPVEEDGIFQQIRSTGEPLVLEDARGDTAPSPWMADPAIQSWIGVPLAVRGKVIGMLALGAHEASRYDEQDGLLAQAFAFQAGVAMENARLYGQARQRRARLAQTLRISEILHRGHGLSEVLREVARGATGLGFRRVAINIRAPDGETLKVHTVRGVSEADQALLLQAAYRWSDFKGLLDTRFQISNSYLIHQGEYSWERDFAGPVLFSGAEDRGRGYWQPETALLVPLRGQGGELIGLVSVDDPEDNRIPDLDTIQTLESLANQAAIAIENTRLIEGEQQRRREAEQLQQLTGALVSTLNSEQVMGNIFDLLEQVLPLDIANAVLYMGEGLEVGAWRGLPHDGYLVGERIRPEVLPYLRRVSQDRRTLVLSTPVEPMPLGIEHLGVESWSAILTPLQVGGEVIGRLAIYKGEEGAYTEAQADLVQSFANQAAVAIQNAQLFEQIRAGRERLQRLSQQLLDVQEQERRRLSLELHDRIGQSLTAVKISVQAVQRTAEGDVVQEALDQIIAITERALNQVRSLSLELRPSMLDDLGLVAALRWYLDQQAQRAGFKAAFRADMLEQRPHPEIETAAYRITQEAITNIIRHAQAQNVWVDLRSAEQELLLTIRDDGRGFVVAEARERAVRGKSVGVLGMEERAQLLGGKLELESKPGHGSVLQVHLPISLSDTLERRTRGRV